MENSRAFFRLPD